ncbi:hypothetical protein [Nonlabens xiamenensis]|uniref:hypothetical protein n=1 Tax=Nonlabens xiamenensis TaxID=2341043 RepID=UPI000F60F82F|nr:hypothetical protein [Nonlabens xiamenensis]
MKDKLLAYLKNNKHYWWTVSLLPGAVLLVFLYQNNFSLINSGIQLLYFLLVLMVLPALAIGLLDFLLQKINPKKRAYLYYVFLLLHILIFGALIIFMGWRWKGLVLGIFIIAISARWLTRHYKKLVLLLGFMLLVGIGQLALQIFTNSWQAWHPQTQAFEKWTFQSRPNIYVIQPDGYVGPNTLSNPPYAYDNGEFMTFLDEKDFAIQENYRSNYPSTLSSNACLFTAQHHYFQGKHSQNELPSARDVIMGANPVLRTLKNNQYQTHAILESNYLLLNRPTLFYDQVNISDNELPYFPFFSKGIDVQAGLEKAWKNSENGPQFFFIEILEPAHVTTYAASSQGKDQERLAYLNRLDSVHIKLDKLLNSIEEKDPDAVILVLADHGGFVGFDSTDQAMSKPIQNLSLKNSIFQALYAVKAPQSLKTSLIQAKSSIEIFPRLFAQLSGQDFQNTMENGSYLRIKGGNSSGIYRYFDDQGESVSYRMNTQDLEAGSRSLKK